MSSTMTSKFNLRDAFNQKMQESNIDQISARRLGFKPLTAEQSPPWLPHRGAGILIPYHDTAGKPTHFSRYRYLEQPRANGFAALAYNDKPLRYVQPGKSASELYLPVINKWNDTCADADIPVVITEGEFKAACVCINTDIPCIGLGGVWSWMSQARKLPLLEQFQDFEWQDRIVYICFDSDAVTNPDVMRAENSLARAMLQEGALPFVVRLPPRGDGKKLGLDDYIVANGTEEFETLLNDTEEWSESSVLHELNEEVVLVRSPCFVYNYADKSKMRLPEFNMLYANRVFNEQTFDSKGKPKLTPKPAAKEWLKWSMRAEVKRMTYAPGQAQITPRNELNGWSGWGVEPRKGNIAPWKRLLKHLFGSNEVDRDWFERWLAYPLQHPGEKMYSSAVVWSREQGTGKSFVGYSMFRIYGFEHDGNATEIVDRDIYATHNEWAMNKQFVMGDEITSKDKRSGTDMLKSMLTRQLLRMNEKYVPTYEIPDCINYYFTSNHPDSFFLEDKDRRFFVHEAVCEPMSREFCQEYEDWIGKPGVTGPGAAALFYHLLTLDLKGMKATDRAPMTMSKQNMLDLGRSDLSSWVHGLVEDADTVLRFDNQIVPFELMSSKDLLAFYDTEGRTGVTANGMTREMTRQGFRYLYKGQTVPTAEGHLHLWAVRNAEKYAKMPGRLIGEAYDNERKQPTKKEPKYK
jgi:hypothetical protein